MRLNRGTLKLRFHANWLFAIAACFIMFLSQELSCQAEVLYQNPETDYEVFIEDDAELLTDEEIAALAETKKPITENGNVGFKSVSYNNQDTNTFAKQFYREIFGKKSGILFVIDMDNRNVYIFSDGAVYRTITRSYANTITDNVYRYASSEQYFDCANEAFIQANTLLEGGRVMQPMKYISNALLAVIIALLLNFAWVCYFSKLKNPSTKDIMRSLDSHFEHTTPTAVMTHETKTYDPQDSGSSSGGSSGGGGGGGSSSSGGGGGHSF